METAPIYVFPGEAETILEKSKAKPEKEGKSTL